MRQEFVLMLGFFDHRPAKAETDIPSAGVTSDALSPVYAGRRHHWRSPNSIMTTAPASRR